MSLKADSLDHNPWGANRGEKALQQLAEILEPVLGGQPRFLPGNTAFVIDTRDRQTDKPIKVAHVCLLNPSTIAVRLCVARVPPDARLAGDFVNALVRTSAQYTLIEPPPEARSEPGGVWFEVRGVATPMGMTRRAAFVTHVTKLVAVAEEMSKHIAQRRRNPDAKQRYKKVSEHLAMVEPWACQDHAAVAALSAWAATVLDVASSGCSVALVAEDAVTLDCGQALLANAGDSLGITLGMLQKPQISVKELVALASAAPGLVVVPATRLALGNSPYEVAGEIDALLASCRSAEKPLILTGRHSELQRILAGGQGSVPDPIDPFVSRVPKMPLAELIRYQVQRCGERAGGLPLTVQSVVEVDVASTLAPYDPGTQRRLLPSAVARSVAVHNIGSSPSTAPLEQVMETLIQASETMSGLPRSGATARSPAVEHRLITVLSDPQLLGRFQRELQGQDSALGEFIESLGIQALTRPGHQPLRILSEGTPGTGKSRSAELLAEFLGMPFVNIDAASMPDPYAATAQLLGSGRGIVGSYKAGRLEEAAKESTGVVVEVSDLDHATPQVRTALSELLLTVMETGQGQSTAGGRFSCANLVLVFTVNLPDGMDTKVTRPLGFGAEPSRAEIRAAVQSELKQLFSAAFLSRVGPAIVFDEIDESGLAAIVERAVVHSIETAASRMDVPLQGLTLEAGLGSDILADTRIDSASLGARIAQERGRRLGAIAFTRHVADCGHSRPCHLHATYSEQAIQLIASE